MKKGFNLLSAFFVIAVLTGCGSDNKENPSTEPVTPYTTTSTSPATHSLSCTATVNKLTANYMVVGDTLNLSVNGQTGSLTRISGVSGSVFGEWNGGSRSENGITYKVSLIIAPASVTNKGTCTSANAEATATATSIAAITSTQIDIKETKSSTATN